MEVNDDLRGFSRRFRQTESGGMTERKPRLTVLTGAGASKPLGLPTMDALLPGGFGESLQHGERDVFDMAANWAMMQNPEVLDFEHLFTGVDVVAQLAPGDALAMVFAPPRAPAPPQTRVGNFLFKEVGGSYRELNFDGYRKEAIALTELLRRVVHERLAEVDTARAAKLYQKLFAFLSAIVGPTGQVDLFTTNYDRAVEASYETGGDDPTGFDFELVRGFTQGARQRAPQWDPGVYERPPGSRFIVKLYKLHGSLDWRREGDAVREVAADEYVGRNAVIYPVRKPIIEEPFRTLLELFRRRLQDSDLCVVIGNSLRDEHIRESLTERLNADALRLVIVDPQADRLASLLEPEIGRDRLTRLVQTAQVRFGGGDEDQRDLEARIGFAAVQAMFTPPAEKEREYVAAMKSDLRNLVTAEEAYFADSVKYTATVGPGGLNFTVTPGNTPPHITLTADGVDRGDRKREHPHHVRHIRRVDATAAGDERGPARLPVIDVYSPPWGEPAMKTCESVCCS